MLGEASMSPGWLESHVAFLRAFPYGNPRLQARTSSEAHAESLAKRLAALEGAYERERQSWASDAAGWVCSSVLFLQQ